jgi:hypothetical protein
MAGRGESRHPRRLPTAVLSLGAFIADLSRSLMEIGALLELLLAAAAELEALVDAELPLELLEVLQRKAATRRRWRPPPFYSLMIRNTRWYLLFL